ncbi:maleylpyruvate isomerase family mycothiol-dependent enzyme [Arthrobacter sp.]|uniref:maleylpyruvate isomerase family mycothiol-dependent enzyme n=1 Tax=Arthrobacter sp. TaxID=1667 RepID=UPI0026DFE232|nr:maleylpyruvate isomerase family mycothiol-dependent enzyme [Arthrobacter sp.]MDO5753346.1 maleylpyruvate isomerase family mycothiol-dependent enzyme [Arthrobacter sp.]
MTYTEAATIPRIKHDEAMEIAAVENVRLSALLRELAAPVWEQLTDCAPWTVRDVVVHITASAQAQASPIEFARQVVVGRPLTAQIGGNHWVDGLNEAQLRARTGWTPTMLPDLWDRHSAAALTARQRLPAPIRALPLLPFGSPLDVHIGWQPLRYLFDVGFTRDTWMHRIDMARAAGIAPQLSAEHDGRIIADIVAEWSGLHSQPYTLTLTGPAGGHFESGGGDVPLTVDAVEFTRILSGRAEGPGVLHHKLPL